MVSSTIIIKSNQNIAQSDCINFQESTLGFKTPLLMKIWVKTFNASNKFIESWIFPSKMPTNKQEIYLLWISMQVMVCFFLYESWQVV